jgi:bifunctional non-homologous end joining protein LigD
MQRMPAPLRFVAPMECKPVARLPEGDDWRYELKLDGYRVIATKDGGDVHLYSRNGKTFDIKFVALFDRVAAIRGKRFVIDGEVVALDEKGRHSFELLQRFGTTKAPLLLYVFDILHLDENDLTRRPLRTRWEVLQGLLRKPPEGVQLVPTLRGSAATVLAKVEEFGFEGVVAKRLDSIYQPGEEPGTWQKHKTQQSADFIVGGYIPDGKSVEQLLVGRWAGKRLMFVESVKNGFVPLTRRQTFAALQRFKAAECPFANLPEKKGAHRMDREKMATVQWCKPASVAEIGFNEMTAGGHLRHARFLRLRDDARAVKKSRPATD